MRFAPTAQPSPAAAVVAMYGRILASEHGSTISIVDPKTVRVTYTDADGAQGDEGQWDADMASVAFNQSVAGVRLIFESAAGQEGSDPGASADDEFGGWLWDREGIARAELDDLADGSTGILVTPDAGVSARALDDLLADSYGGYRVAVTGSAAK